ncbi:MAG: EAL domain-containing protein [Lachnospiraceae bacterium]|nr:EAL domain-containing protein [Lachnospiraceae bacterium]
MDFQKIVENMPAMTCIVSVELLPDGRCGKFRLVAGNKAYVDSIEHPAPGAQMLKDKFVPNSEYTDYLTRDLNFEDYCYRAAVEKKCLHSYAHPDRMAVWLNMFFLPLCKGEDGLYYCYYTMEINFEPDSSQIANVSSEMAQSVLDTCIRLRGTNDFRATMKEVIAGIRELCDAEHCCILVMNDLERSCYVLGEAFSKDTRLLPMENYVNDEFYDIADSWTATIAGSNCLIVKDEHDMELIKERNPVWYESITSAGGKNIVLFPLKSRNRLLGYMWAINYDPSRSVRIKETLEITTFIVGSELGNYLLLDRLRKLSSKDMLTGVMNRNEMNNYVDSLCHGDAGDVPVGVIFADLNGLKAINDLEGHNAGDLLLKNAANVLRESFEEKQIFRAGGDEFAIILTGITEEELNGRMDAVRKACEKYGNLFFALGGHVEKDSRNVRIALKSADEKMYEDKRIFYEKHKERMAGEQERTAREEETDALFRERSIFQEVNYDQLTGLASMTYFFKLAETARRNMQGQGIPAALLYINLRGLKYYNKRYGFAEGDALIKDFARILSQQFGEECCSRFGQDHFGVFTETEDLEKKLNRVFREARDCNGGRSLPVRAGIYLDSMGFVESSLACDRAKSACDAIRPESQSCFRYFDDKMLQRENNRQYIIDNLDRAINENWIKAFYQPIIRATNRRVCDEEALARWIDPEKGMLSPAEFIPILEDTRLIYKVDLHILDLIIEKMKSQKNAGLHVVPVSVNLSRTDFEVCDIVEEITNRVDAAGISRDMITIEITESVVGENFEFMKEQVERFKRLGFKVWMDDFGSGYSSLDLLQEIQFDLIKFDMRFMRQFEQTPKSRIILKELMRMALNLGTETVCEGVETIEQVQFLSEIGCTKLQGYYFCKPIPLEDILDRYRRGIQIGFEIPEEVGYYEAISTINLYDLGSVTNDDPEKVRHYFDTLPMAVVEYDGEVVRVIRCNRSYKDFLKRYFNINSVGDANLLSDIEEETGPGFVDALRSCSEQEGNQSFVDEKMYDGSTVHSMIKKVAGNPVRGVSAFAIAVLAITPENESRLTYAHVAQALSSDYIDLYYVDVETEVFTQYSIGGEGSSISSERSGMNFFEQCRRDAMIYLYEEDRDKFQKAYTRENVLKAIDEEGVFHLTYRLMMDGEPVYVSMKGARLKDDDKHIIIGVSNVDTQMRQQEALERLREEQTIYSRIAALMGDFIAIYTVDPETGAYMEYSATKEFQSLDTSMLGMDFFEDSRREIESVIYPDDLEHFHQEFTRERILEKTGDGGVFKMHYRLVFDGKPVMMTLRAGLVREKDRSELIIGLNKTESEDR